MSESPRSASRWAACAETVSGGRSDVGEEVGKGRVALGRAGPPVAPGGTGPGPTRAAIWWTVMA